MRWTTAGDKASLLREFIGYGRGISRLMINDLKEQEGVDRVGGLQSGRDEPNPCAAFCFREFVANLFLELGHRRGARRVGVVDEHGCLEVHGRYHLVDMSTVHADLLDSRLVVG